MRTYSSITRRMYLLTLLVSTSFPRIKNSACTCASRWNRPITTRFRCLSRPVKAMLCRQLTSVFLQSTFVTTIAILVDVFHPYKFRIKSYCYVPVVINLKIWNFRKEFTEFKHFQITTTSEHHLFTEKIPKKISEKISEIRFTTTLLSKTDLWWLCDW